MDLIRRSDAMKAIAYYATKPIDTWTFDELQEKVSNIPAVNVPEPTAYADGYLDGQRDERQSWLSLGRDVFIR